MKYLPTISNMPGSIYNLYKRYIKRFIPRSLLVKTTGFLQENTSVMKHVQHAQQLAGAEVPYVSVSRQSLESPSIEVPKDGPHFTIIAPTELVGKTTELLEHQPYPHWTIIEKNEELPSNGYTIMVDEVHSLLPRSLSYYAESIAAHPNADIVYGDVAIIEQGSKKGEWIALPNYSPLLHEATSYIPQTAARRIGNNTIESAVHIPTVTSIASKPYIITNNAAVRTTANAKSVSIIIPTKDEVEMLERCLSSIQKFTTVDYEIIVVNNQSTRASELTELCNAYDSVTLMEYDKPFHYAAINNVAAQNATGDYLLLLNDDTEVTHSGWLKNMLELATRSEVGIVGAKLLFPNDAIQHAGFYLTTAKNGIVDYWHKGVPSKRDEQTEPGYLNSLISVREVDAVTAACMLISKPLFEELGGFDEDLRIGFNDIDLCLRAREFGYLTVYDPDAVLYHHESFSRMKTAQDAIVNHPEDSKRFMAKWKKQLDGSTPFIHWPN